MFLCMNLILREFLFTKNIALQYDSIFAKISRFELRIIRSSYIEECISKLFIYIEECISKLLIYNARCPSLTKASSTREQNSEDSTLIMEYN